MGVVQKIRYDPEIISPNLRYMDARKLDQQL